MEIPLIAASILPYIIRGGEKLAEEIGADFWELLKKPFTKEKDKQLLQRLNENPKDESARIIAKYKIEETLEENTFLKEKLEKALEKYSIVQKQNSISVAGNQNNTVQDIINSSVNINK